MWNGVQIKVSGLIRKVDGVFSKVDGVFSKVDGVFFEVHGVFVEVGERWLWACILRPTDMTYNRAAAMAVDREFESKLWLPCFPGGPAPRTPEKALRALGCSGCSLSRDRADCPVQLRCLGQNLFSKE